MTLDRTVPPFAPIGLAELLARAELLTRTDRKYLLPGADLPVLLRALPTGTRVLEIDGRRRFAYRSAYFDTPGLDSYLASARRRRRRFKLRVRGYLDTGQQFVELKTRGARNTTVKSRFPYAGSADRLDPATRDLASSLLAAAAMPPVTGEFQLTLVTTYERMTLILPGTATRVTVDRELAWQLPGGESRALPGRVVVETKSAGAVSPADRLLWSLAHRPVPLSKYATGLAALRPGLPATNRWHPVLRRHFPAGVLSAPTRPEGSA